MPTKKDVSSIITNGTLKQRLNLLFSHYAVEQFTREGFLTETEVGKIVDSFKTPQERRQYNRFVRIDARVRNAIHYLNQLRLGYREQMAYISGYCLLHDSLYRTAELLNETLAEVKDHKLKNRLIKKIIESNHYLFGTIAADKDGIFPSFKSGHIGFLDILNAHKGQAEGLLSTSKTTLRAFFDYLDETGFNIKEYKDFVRKLEADLQEDKATIWRYSKKQMIENAKKIEKVSKDVPLDDLPKDTQAAISRFIDIMNRESFYYPDYETIEVDEDEYTFFKENYLNEK